MPQPSCCCFEPKVNGFHRALVFTASLSEVDWFKTMQSVQPKLICCIENFNFLAGNWTLVLCERFMLINPCRAKSFNDGSRALFVGFNALTRIMENGFL